MGTKVTPVADFGQVSPPLQRQWLVLPVSPWEGETAVPKRALCDS